MARMSQLRWYYVDDPSNETDEVNMVEFSLDAPSQATETTSARRGKARRLMFPAPMFAAFGVMCAIMGLIVAGISFYWDYRMTSLEKAGTQTVGEIERIYSESGRGGRSYYVSYRFVDTRGLSHESDDILPFDDWKMLRQGDQISVTYLADDPAQNDLTQRVRLFTGTGPKDGITLLGIFWAMAGCFFVGYWMRRRRS